MNIIRPRLPVLIICVFLCLPSALALAQEDMDSALLDLSVADRVEYYENQVQELVDGVQQLVQYYGREAEDRDKLVLQQRFVLGRDFHFLIGEYRAAAEIFYGIVNHPSAQSFPNLTEAQYYLAESLFQIKYFDHSYQRFMILHDDGAASEYSGPALVRLIQVSIYRNDYASAQKFYSELLGNLPEDYDGSLGMYIMGRAAVEKGDAARGTDILENIPQTGDYYCVGQYFLAVMDVRRENYPEAIKRLRQLKNSLTPESLNPTKKAVYAQMNLALARLHYELDDYPQAVSSYLSVPVDSPSYAEAMYENLWVLLTRNDNLLRRIEKEWNEYDKLNRNYGEFADIVDITGGQGDTAAFAGQVDSLQGDMSNVRKMLDQIDDYLSNMQQDAVDTFVQLARNAPNSPFLPEAELLIGKTFTQAEDYDKAHRLFEIARRKYADYYSRLKSRAAGLDNDRTLLEFVQSAFYKDESAFNGSVPPGVPGEIAYWMAADESVRRVFEIYENALHQRLDLDEIRNLVVGIEHELAKLERDDTFPIFKGAHLRSLELLDHADALMEGVGELQEVEDLDSDDAETLAKLASRCEKQKGDLRSLRGTLEGKKSLILAQYRQNFKEIIAPIPALRPEVSRIYAEAADAAVRTARFELSEMRLKLSRYEQKARIGIIDADYRKAEMASRKIKSIQKEMNEELRRFKMQYRIDKVMSTDETEAASDNDAGGSKDGEGGKDKKETSNDDAPKENQ